MIVRKDGMVYEVRNFGKGHQVVSFTRKRPDGSFADGTTIEEVLLMLRHKLYHFQRVNPSEYNEKIIKLMDIALDLCNERLMAKKELLKNKEDGQTI